MIKKYFEIERKIYLYDTDSTDIVYYARHLEWMEMARIELITEVYKPLKKMIEEDKISFMPINVNISYKAPAVFEDTIKIKVGFKEIDKIRLVLDYKIVKNADGKEIVVSEAEITMLCINVEKGARPAKIPEHIINKIKEWEEK